MGQVTDETHGIRQGHRAPGFAQIQLTGGGVERGKQLIGSIGPGFDQPVEQRRFARIGVTHERDREGVAAFALAALGGTLFLDLLQPLLGALDGLSDHAPVQLDLGFAWTTAHANAATLPLQVRPTAHQPG